MRARNSQNMVRRGLLACMPAPSFRIRLFYFDLVCWTFRDGVVTGQNEVVRCLTLSLSLRAIMNRRIFWMTTREGGRGGGRNELQILLCGPKKLKHGQPGVRRSPIQFPDHLRSLTCFYILSPRFLEGGFLNQLTPL